MTTPDARVAEVAWLIERNDIPWGGMPAGGLLYLFEPGRAGRHDWTPDVDRAKRFSSERDALAYINHDPALRVVEHMWMRP